LNKEEIRKEGNIEEDKYIYYRTKPAISEVSDPNERENGPNDAKVKKGK
jgi:hypothetical protein